MKPMHYTRGPIRLTLINSGVYDYAEIELDRPLHLVGPNNSGKTTLISALQFLYIDHFGEMSFPYSSRKTREYYFPSRQSFILFECLTPQKHRVVGVRGLGELQQYDFDRFAYEGSFDRSDFLDDRKVRPWKEIQRRLIGKGLQSLEASDLREGLLASGKGEVDLGLVPLENDGRYRSFSFIFKNLLRLADLNRGDFKELLIDTNRGELGTVELDVRDRYEEQYETLKSEKRSLSKLKESTDAIRELLEAVDRRTQLRGEIIGLWEQLQRHVEERRGELEAKLESLQDDIEQVGKKHEETSRKLKGLRKKREGKLREQGKLADRIEQLKKREREFEDFDPQRAESRREKLDDEIHHLRVRIDDASDADREKMERRRDELLAQLEKNRDQLAGLAESAITWLREEVELEDADIDDVFRVLNPELLTLSMASQKDGEALELRNEERLRRRLVNFVDRFDDDGYEDETIRIARLTLSDESAAEDYGSAAKLKARIERLEKECEQCKTTLTDLKRREKLEEQLCERKTKRKDLDTRLAQWNELQKKKEKRRGWVERRRVLNAEIEKLKKESTALEEQLRDLQEKNSKLKSKRSSAGTRLEELQRDVRQLSRPDEVWKERPDPVADLPESLRSFFEQYRQRWQTLREVQDDVGKLRREVEQVTGGRYIGESFEETLENLRDALEAVDEKESTLEKQWEGLVANLAGELNQLDTGLQRLRRVVSRLNKSLNQRRISNLESVKLQVELHDRIVDKIREVVEWEETPLFSSASEGRDATRFVADLLDDYGQLELKELFELAVVVHKADGEKEKVVGLGTIESRGTTTTVKVLVHLHLLEMMLVEDKAFIPFFLDEVSTLDDHNLRVIVEHATEMNFVPVVASPDPGDCVGRLYLLDSVGDGRVWLDPEIARHDIEPTDPVEAADAR